MAHDGWSGSCGQASSGVATHGKVAGGSDIPADHLFCSRAGAPADGKPECDQGNGQKRHLSQT